MTLRTTVPVHHIKNEDNLHSQFRSKKQPAMVEFFEINSEGLAIGPKLNFH
jgi:hypothetical protein